MAFTLCGTSLPLLLPRRRLRFFDYIPLQTTSARLSARASAHDAASVESAPLQGPTLRELCRGRVPDHVMQRAEDIGYVYPTNVQEEALPLLLSGRDCVLHAQTGSGKTLAYLLSVFSAIDSRRAAVQALILVPTRELGIQVTKVARKLAAKPTGFEGIQEFTIMTLLDGGQLKRHKSWLKAEPPEVVVATVKCLCQMLEKNIFSLKALRVLVIDEVDFLFNSSNQTYSLRKLLNLYSSTKSRQTVFASASIPQHNHFLYECIQEKWTKDDVVHVHVNHVEPIPSHICHKFVICTKEQKLQTLLLMIQKDVPRSAIIFVSEQSEKSKRAGQSPSTMLVLDFLQASYFGNLEVHLLEEEMNFNARAASFSEIGERDCLLVSTDIASRGFDLPQTTHIYNFELPRNAVDYLHRAGRTGRTPFVKDQYTVTSLITKEELFVLRRFENELMFQCEELHLDHLTNTTC